jgi:hypothetical protein
MQQGFFLGLPIVKILAKYKTAQDIRRLEAGSAFTFKRPLYKD